MNDYDVRYGGDAARRSKEPAMNMTDEQLKAMSKDEANNILCGSDQRRWVRLHNATANLYFIKDGKITDVNPAGWWY